PFDLGFDYKIESDSLYIDISNTIKSSLRFAASIDDPPLQRVLNQAFPLLLNPLTDTSFVFPWPIDTEPKFKYYFGNGKAPTSNVISNLPYPKGLSYKIVQGYNGSFSHNHDFSRYAIDFDLKVGDTICAVEKGVVIGHIEAYKDGGSDRKWRPYANYVMLYHPHKNLYTQYVHLDHNGILVEMGDTVLAGQVIGISGLTGFTGSEHLHFNVLRSDSTVFKSIPFQFENGITGKDLKPGIRARRKPI
ncbi:MAG: M23 family metallopeptidase, partial [Bacteroidota bacterium]